MIKKLSFAAVALAIGAGAMVPAAPAAAQDYRYQRGDYYDQQYRGYDSRYDNRGYYNNGYDNRGYYDNRRNYRRNFDNRRCNDGTGGAIIGAIAGGLLGNTVAGRGDRGIGTVLGALGGGVAGRAIERGGNNGCSGGRRW